MNSVSFLSNASSALMRRKYRTDASSAAKAVRFLPHTIRAKWSVKGNLRNSQKL
jgi:hypothetical protein